jgi:hypothetical protein
MSVKSRVSTTPNSVVGNTKVQNQWHRVRLVGQISHYLNVSTMLTTAFKHLLCFNLMRCAKKVKFTILSPLTVCPLHFANFQGSQYEDSLEIETDQIP